MSFEPSPTDAWALARNRYREDLSQEELGLFDHASWKELLRDASALHKHHEMRSKQRAAARKLKPFLSALEAHGPALDVVSNIMPLFLAPIWGGLRVLLRIARDHERLFEMIAEMFGRIGDILPRLQVYEKLFSDDSRLAQALSQVYQDIMSFCMEVKVTLRKASLRNLRVFVARRDEFKSLLDRIGLHAENVEREALASYMEDSKRRVEEVAQSHAELKTILKRLESTTSALTMSQGSILVISETAQLGVGGAQPADVRQGVAALESHPKLGPMSSVVCEREDPLNNIESDMDIDRDYLTSCYRNCECLCHNETSLEQSWWNTVLGSLFIRAVGQPFGPSVCKRGCRRRSTPLISVVYYCPPWLSTRGLGLCFLNGPVPSLTLPCARIVPPDAEIAVCIRDGNCQRVAQLLLTGNASPVDVIAPYGFTTLSLAIYHGKPEICKLLAATGAHQDSTTTRRLPDIHNFWATFSIVKYSITAAAVVKDLLNFVSQEYAAKLLAVGANLRLGDYFGLAPIHVAAIQGELDMIKLLLREGVDIESLDNFQETPLMWATLANQPAAVELLCKRGANIDHREVWGDTALWHALLVNAYEVLEVLLLGERRASTDLLPCTKQTILHMAAQHADGRTMELLMSANLRDINSMDKDAEGRTAWEYLSKRNGGAALAEAFKKLVRSIEREEFFDTFESQTN